MKNLFDMMEREYIFDHGWQIDDDGILVLTKKQFRDHQYTGRSYRDNSIRTLMLPTTHGTALIFEGKHFRVI